MKTVNIRGTVHSVKPRTLWQQLFNFYRENGGDLDNLDNLLVDFNNCRELFNSQDRLFWKTTKFVWGLRDDGMSTDWLGENLLSQTSDPKLLFSTPMKCIYLCEVHQYHMTFARLD